MTKTLTTLTLLFLLTGCDATVFIVRPSDIFVFGIIGIFIIGVIGIVLYSIIDDFIRKLFGKKDKDDE